MVGDNRKPRAGSRGASEAHDWHAQPDYTARRAMFDPNSVQQKARPAGQERERRDHGATRRPFPFSPLSDPSAEVDTADGRPLGELRSARPSARLTD